MAQPMQQQNYLSQITCWFSGDNSFKDAVGSSFLAGLFGAYAGYITPLSLTTVSPDQQQLVASAITGLASSLASACGRCAYAGWTSCNGSGEAIEYVTKGTMGVFGGAVLGIILLRSYETTLQTLFSQPVVIGSLVISGLAGGILGFASKKTASALTAAGIGLFIEGVGIRLLAGNESAADHIKAVRYSIQGLYGLIGHVPLLFNRDERDDI